ncbi:MAG: hypothetical protein WC693_02885 [Patescibacteria group bacterium]
MTRSLSGKSGKGDQLHQRDDEGDPHAPHPRSIHEMTCFERHSKMAVDGHRKCADCGENLRPLQSRKLK